LELSVEFDEPKRLFDENAGLDNSPVDEVASVTLRYLSSARDVFTRARSRRLNVSLLEVEEPEHSTPLRAEGGSQLPLAKPGVAAKLLLSSYLWSMLFFSNSDFELLLSILVDGRVLSQELKGDTLTLASGSNLKIESAARGGEVLAGVVF
jgi:hypothetical protein